MLSSRRQKRQAPTNLLQLKPERQREWERLESSGLAVILIPKFTGKWLGKLLQPRLRHPYEKINLDHYGTAVWELCDGNTSVHEIAAALRAQFGKEIEPLLDRLSLFMQMLEEKKLIRYINLEEQRSEEITQA